MCCFYCLIYKILIFESREVNDMSFVVVSVYCVEIGCLFNVCGYIFYCYERYFVLLFLIFGLEFDDVLL